MCCLIYPPHTKCVKSVLNLLGTVIFTPLRSASNKQKNVIICCSWESHLIFKWLVERINCLLFLRPWQISAPAYTLYIFHAFNNRQSVLIVYHFITNQSLNNSYPLLMVILINWSWDMVYIFKQALPILYWVHLKSFLLMFRLSVHRYVLRISYVPSACLFLYKHPNDLATMFCIKCDIYEYLLVCVVMLNWQVFNLYWF